MKSLKDKIVLVTGSTSGIGFAIAKEFALNGARVVMNTRSVDDDDRKKFKDLEKVYLEATGKEKGCLLVEGDVAIEKSVSEMFASVIDKMGSLDILVNNAGVMGGSKSENLEVEDFENVLKINLTGSFLCAREAINIFQRFNKNGNIVNISSVHEAIPKPGYLAYSVSKGGVGNLTRTLALEFASAGIRVNGVAPGATATKINSAWKDDAEKKEKIAEHIPLGTIAAPEDISPIVSFLASDLAKYITGQTIYVDGGLTLYADFEKNWSS